MGNSLADYEDDRIEAAKAVLIELARILNDFWPGMVVVGGWVPFFLIPQDVAPHEGTIDIDIVLDAHGLETVGYSIHETLIREKYQEVPRRPFCYERSPIINEPRIKVRVEFLTYAEEGEAYAKNVREIQEVQASIIQGCEIAFLNPEEREIEGNRPDGAQDRVTIRTASVENLLAMKGNALEGRGANKDAYDIYYLLLNYPGGVEAIAERCKPYLQNAVFRLGIERIGKHFAQINSIGPVMAANADRYPDAEERAIRQRDAYERAKRLMEELGIIERRELE